jgi:nucleoside-diphosphate kinase
MKMVHIDKEFAEKHYPKDLIPILGNKTLADWEEMGIKSDKKAEELGTQCHKQLINYATESPIIAIVFEGVHAVMMVRKMVGHTSPHKANPGTIRADFSTVSMGYCTTKGFGGRNLIHASGSVDEAKREIDLWFTPKELFEYSTVHEKHFR